MKLYLVTIFIIVLSMGFIPLVSALDQEQDATIGECYRVKQSCASCSYVNISSVTYPNSSIAISNVSMEDFGNGEWYYNFCNVTLKGRYDILGQGDLDGIDTSFATYFTTQELDIQKAILYLGLLGFLTLTLTFILYSIPKLPNGNKVNDEGFIMEIDNLKFLRPILYGVSWGLILAIFFIVSNVSITYLTDDLLGDIFFLIFRVLFMITLPMLIIWFIYIFTSIWRDKQVKQLLQRGIDVGGGKLF